jgi:hypothetical protein
MARGRARFAQDLVAGSQSGPAGATYKFCFRPQAMECVLQNIAQKPLKTTTGREGQLIGAFQTNQNRAPQLPYSARFRNLVSAAPEPAYLSLLQAGPNGLFAFSWSAL